MASKIIRRKAKIIKIGNVYIGGNNPVTIQSMTKVKTTDIKAALGQIKALEDVGCEIIRCAVKDVHDARALRKIKQETKIPLVADIHFNWRFAIEAIDSGVDKIRLNPGNIYKREQIREIARAAKINRIPIRVGVNSGSLPQTAKPCKSQTETIADKMVKSALAYIKILEGFNFYDIVVSLKGSNIFDTIEAYRKIAKLCDYPLHLGVTATGLAYAGMIKSSIALGILLLGGIGDTIRVSLTDRPEQEVKVAKGILESLGLRCFGPEIISCPTCGRCEVDLVKIVKQLGNSLARWPVGPLARPSTSLASARGGMVRGTNKRIKVAVMGCVVNGPGEAREADIGVAFGRKEGLLFKQGRPVRKIAADRCGQVLLEEVLKAS